MPPGPGDAPADAAGDADGAVDDVVVMRFAVEPLLDGVMLLLPPPHPTSSRTTNALRRTSIRRWRFMATIVIGWATMKLKGEKACSQRRVWFSEGGNRAESNAARSSADDEVFA
jgi:hypothetical protein